MKRLINLWVCLSAVWLAASCAKDAEPLTGNIQGIVTESGTTTPLSGVQVRIVGNGLSATTGGDGQFSFHDLDAETYNLQFMKDGYETNTRSVTVLVGETANCDMQLRPEQADAGILIEPSTLDFGSTQSEMAVTITNKGNTTTEWSLNLGENPWLSASPASGNIAAGRTQSIVFAVDRDQLAEAKTARVTLAAFGNSYTISVSCSPRTEAAEMTVSPTILDFGTELSELSLDIRNTGNAELNYQVSGLTVDYLTVSAMSGAVAAGGNQVLKVNLDRELMPSAVNTTFVISDGTKETVITVTATKTEGGDDEPVAGETVVTQGLYTYYKFDGNYEDATENAVHGFGTCTFVDGVSGGQALKFSRTENTTFTVGSPIIDSREMTFSFWGKDFADGHIFHLLSSNANDPMFTLSLDGGALKFVVTRYHNIHQYGAATAFTHPALTDGKWHHIAIVSDFETTAYGTITNTLYVDGLRVGSVTETANHFSENGGSQSSYDTGTTFVMGGSLKLSNSVTLNATNMTVDNFRVYDNRMLSGSEIKEIYEAKQ